MPTLESANRLYMLVNVFTVDEDRQDELMDLLVRATEQTMQPSRLRVGQCAQESRWHEAGELRAVAFA